MQLSINLGFMSEFFSLEAAFDFSRNMRLFVVAVKVVAEMKIIIDHIFYDYPCSREISRLIAQQIGFIFTRSDHTQIVFHLNFS